MANDVHVRLVLSGAIHLNPWREANSRVRLDLQGAVLKQADLSECNLSGVDLADANLIGTKLWRANLRGAVLTRSDLSHANLSEACLDNALCHTASCHSANFSHASCVQTSFEGSTFIGANLTDAYFMKANLSQCDLSGVGASGSIFAGANFERATCARASLMSVDLTGAKLHAANLDGCDLSHSTLDQADLNEADVSNAKLQYLEGVVGALNLVTVRTNGKEQYFESCFRHWPERYLDWEKIRGIGRFQLFGVSYSLLLYLITSFYVIGQYNKKVELAHDYLETVAADGDAPRWERLAAKKGLVKLTTFGIARSSVVLLCATMLLILASGLYTVGCPEEIKEFTRVQWCYQLNRSLIHYWGYAWQRRWLRVACAALYAVGGSSFLVVTLMKMADAVRYAWQYVGA